MLEEKEITFYFSVYNEFDLAIRLLNQIRFFYPHNQIICVTDGTTDLKFESLCKDSNVKYFVGRRLFPQRFGAAWSTRMLLSYLSNSPSKYLVKLDPDSFLNRKFRYLPNTDLAGTLCSELGMSFIQGGCIFYKREACEQILDSSLLNAARYQTDPRFGYQRFCRLYKTRTEDKSDEWFTAEDKIMSDAAQKLKLTLGNWSEVLCRFRGYCPNGEKYAVIHPVK